MVKIFNKDGKELLDVPGDTLENAMLANSYLREADLSDANLSGADLRDANLTEASLNGTCLDGAKLDNAVMDRVNADDASFVTASLISVSLENAKLHRANFTNAQITEANMNFADLTCAKFENATVYVTSAVRASFRQCTFTDATVTCITTLGGDFRGVDMRRAKDFFWLREGETEQGSKTFMSTREFFDLTLHQGPEFDHTSTFSGRYPNRPFQWIDVLKLGGTTGLVAIVATGGFQRSFFANVATVATCTVAFVVAHWRVIRRTNEKLDESPAAFFGTAGHGIEADFMSMLGLKKPINYNAD